jgi:Tfp pilus assembly protein FimT
MSRPGSSGGAGFSLVEVFIVLFILGLAIATGIPFLRGYLQSKGLDATAGAFISQLDLARHRAVTERNPFHILLNDPAPGQYRVHDDDNSNNAIDDGEDLNGPFELGRGIEFGVIDLAGDGGLVFESSGTLRTGQGGTITLRDGLGRPLVLQIFASGIAVAERPS